VNPNLAQVLVVVVIRSQGLLGILAVAEVLVVDDDPAVQMMIRLVLERAATCSMVMQCLAGETRTPPDRNVASGR
jgi:hypothetical protein